MTLSYTCDNNPIDTVKPSTVSVSSAAEGGEIAMSGLVVEDPDGEFASLGHRPFTIDEGACDQQRLFTGWTMDRGIGRSVEDGMYGTATARTHEIGLMDLNALFRFRIIAGTDGNRPAETWNERITWLLGSDYLSDLITDTGYVVSNTTAVNAADYRDAYPADVLSDLMDRSGDAYTYFAFFDPAVSVVALWVGHLDDAVSDSTISISNDLTDIDYDLCFPPDPGARLSITPTETYSEVVVEYAHGTKRLYSSRAATAAKYIRRGTKISRPYTGGVATAGTQAEAFLNQHANEQDRITVTIQVPKERVGLVQAGQRLAIKLTHLDDYTAFVSMRVVRCTVRPVDDLAQFYLLELELLSPRTPSANPCESEGPTTVGFYPPNNNSGDSDALGLITYSKAGMDYPTVATPFYDGNFHFPLWGSDGSPDYGEAAYWGSEQVRIHVIGPGTVRVYTATAAKGGVGPSDTNRFVLHRHIADSNSGDHEETSDDYAWGETVDMVIPYDGHCGHYVVLTGYDNPVNCWVGFAGFDWISEADTEVILPPPPGAPITHTSDPTVDDASPLTVGQTWVNTATGESFVLVDNTTGAAVWASTTSAVTDHGALTGLLDDDHTQYTRKTDGGKEIISTVADAGAAATLDLVNGNVHDVTLTADCTLTFAGATADVACSFTLLLRQDGTGGWTTTWPGSIVWAGGSAPVLDETLSTVEVLTFFTLDGGTTWYGFPTGGGGGGGDLPVYTADSDTSVEITAGDGSTGDGASVVLAAGTGPAGQAGGSAIIKGGSGDAGADDPAIIKAYGGDGSGNAGKVKIYTDGGYGTSGQVFTSDGTYGTWEDATGGGGTPASTVESETTFGIAAAVGADTEYARQDHTHGTPADPTSGFGDIVTHDASEFGAPITEIVSIPTAEMDDTLVLAPDGAGGVEFRAESGGGGDLPVYTAADDTSIEITGGDGVADGGGRVTLAGGAGGAGLAGGRAVLAGGDGDAGTDAAAQVRAYGGDGSGNSGKVMILTGGSTGDAGEVLTSDGSNAVVWEALPGPTFTGCKVTRASNQTIGNASYTAIQFDVADTIDTDAFHDPASSNTDCTIPAGLGGVYRVTGWCRYNETNYTGERYLKIHVGGTGIAEFQQHKNGAALPVTLETEATLVLAASDIVTLQTYQDSGANRTVNAAALVLERLGS